MAQLARRLASILMSPLQVALASALRLDATTHSEYTVAALAAAIGSRRAAAATAIVNAMHPAHRLRIYKNGVQIVAIDYSGDMVSSSDGTDRFVAASSTISSTTIAQNATLADGIWTFEIQGGTNYARKIKGTVGATGSGNDMILSADMDTTASLSLSFNFKIPRALDGLS